MAARTQEVHDTKFSHSFRTLQSTQVAFRVTRSFIMAVVVTCCHASVDMSPSAIPQYTYRKLRISLSVISAKFISPVSSAEIPSRPVSRSRLLFSQIRKMRKTKHKTTNHHSQEARWVAGGFFCEEELRADYVSSAIRNEDLQTSFRWPWHW
jgi:hypothetical protein